MSEPTEVNDVNVTDDGNPRTGVVVSQPDNKLSRPGVMVGAALTGLLAMLSMTILVLYLAPSVDRLTEATALGAEERGELMDTIASLQDRLDAISVAQDEERAVDDCLTLYLSDVEVAKGVASVTLGDNLARSVFTTEVVTDLQLGQEIFEANQALRDALAALAEYKRINPPPGVCPYPDS